MILEINNHILTFNNILFDEEEITIKFKNIVVNYDDFIKFLYISEKTILPLPDLYEERLDIIVQNLDYMIFSNNPLIHRSTAINIASVLIKNNEIRNDDYIKNKIKTYNYDNNFYFDYLLLLTDSLKEVERIKKIKIRKKDKKVNNELTFSLLDLIYNNY